MTGSKDYQLLSATQLLSTAKHDDMTIDGLVTLERSKDYSTSQLVTSLISGVKRQENFLSELSNNVGELYLYKGQIE